MLKKNQKKNTSIKIKSELTNHFLSLLMIVKIYHWKTHSYAEHKATDELYERLNENFDKFVEVMMGRYDIRLNMKGKSIKFTDPSTKKDFKKIIFEFRTLIENDMNKYINVLKDTDLLNIRDEILGNLDQFLYLLTLNK
jgi:DNA-binding ferritin-like protein